MKGIEKVAALVCWHSYHMYYSQSNSMTQRSKQFHLFPALYFFQNSNFLLIITVDIISLISCEAK